MKRALVAVLFGCMTLGFASLAFAGNNIQASIALHVGAYTQKNVCTAAGPLTNGTMAFDNIAPFGNYSVYLLVCNGSDRDLENPSALRTGVAGFQCGIDYNGAVGAGVDVFGWTLCANQEFAQPGWPASGTGNTITWAPATDCQDVNSEPYVPGTVIAIGGVFAVEVLSPDFMSVIPRPVDGKAKVADCNAAEDDITFNTPSQLGIAGFGLPGYNPCGLPTPVQNSTWGGIKKAYE